MSIAAARALPRHEFPWIDQRTSLRTMFPPVSYVSRDEPSDNINFVASNARAACGGRRRPWRGAVFR